jgi:FlaA1/EpsC-like NDP-sugar epimerase
MRNKRILITGGSGSWGQELTRQILSKDPEQIVIFSRNEAMQVAMKIKFNDSRIKFVIGDIREPKAIMEACEGINYVINCSALKHIDVCEKQPREAVKTNIYGVQNVIDACIANCVEVCIHISSDKACNPNLIYGQTKAISERLIIEANNQTLNTDFFCVRSGNILGSAGSVITIWIKQIAEQNCIYLTNPLMTRFFITVQDAVSLTLKAMNKSDRGEVFVFRMPSFYVQSLSELIVDYYGDSKTKIKKLDPRPGESVNELLVTEDEAERTLVSKDYFIVYPLIDVKTANYPKITNVTRLKHEYSSGDVAVYDKDELLKLVQKAGYCL